MNKKWTARLLAVMMMFGQTAWASAAEDTTAPVTSPNTISGTYSGPFTVTLTSNEPGEIYYTLDGSEPTETNHAGSGQNTGVEVAISGFYTELRYRAKDTAGNWEYVNSEVYKISNDPVVTVTDAGQRYTNYADADGSNLVYAESIYDGEAWAYKEIHLRQSGSDTTIAAGLTEEAEFTAISGDHVIYGSESRIDHYSISTGQTTPVYVSTLAEPDINRAKLDGSRIAFIEDGKLKVLDISNPAAPQLSVLNVNPEESISSSNAYDLLGDRVVWQEGDKVYLKNLSGGASQPVSVLNDIYVDHLMLTNTALYYANNGSLFSLNTATGATSKIVDTLSYNNSSRMEIDNSYVVYHGFSDGDFIGVLNLNTKVVKYLDFDGAYSNLGTFSINNGVVYWSKEHLFYDNVYKIEKAPLYSLNLNGLPADSTSPEVSLYPNGASFEWDGAAKFTVNEEALIRLTLDGTTPTETHSYQATMFDKAPVFTKGEQIKYYAVDFAGNSSSVQTSGTFTVANEAIQATYNDEWEEFAAAGSSIVYTTWSETNGSKLYIYDIPTRTSTLLADEFIGDYLDFDGRYIVYETGDWFQPEIKYMDLATGQSGTIAENARNPYVKDGKVVFVDTSGPNDGVSVYDFAKRGTPDETTDLHFSSTFNDIDDPYISGNLVVFENFEYDSGTFPEYVYSLDTQTLTELTPPGTNQINQAVPADGKVFITADNYDKLFVYDIASGEYTDLTALSGAAYITDLSADKIFGGNIALTDSDSQKIVLYNVESGSFTSIGSGEFELYNPQVAGNALAVKWLGLPNHEAELFFRLLSADAAPPEVVATPAAGTYNAKQTVSLAVYGEAASIFYTLDGSTPTADAKNKYYGPIDLNETATLKYFAVDTSGNRSEVQTVPYIIDREAPLVTVDPPGGIYLAPVTVSLSSNEPGTITYSLDGTEPSVTWSVYEQSHGLTLSADTVLKYKAADEVGNVSEVNTVNYIIDPEAFQVSVTPAGGLYHNDVSVTFAVYKSVTADVYYTLDGTEPSVKSARYSGPFVLTHTAALKYFARDKAGNRTPVVEVDYTIEKIPPAAVLVPVNKSRGILVNHPITAAFDEDVTLDNPGGVRMTLDGGAVAGISVSLSGRVLTVNHEALQKGKTYLLQIAADTVHNSNGVGNEPIEWSFTTEFELPSAVSTPANGATGVSLDASVTVAFSESVAENDLSGITISKNGNPLEGVHATLTHAVLTISHDRFEHGTVYTMTIPANAIHNADGIGNHRIEWSFTTEREASSHGSSGSQTQTPQTQAPQTLKPDNAEDGNRVKLGEGSFSASKGTTEDGKTLTTIQVDAGRLTEAAGALNERGASTVLLQVEGTSDTVKVNVPAAALANAAAGSPNAVLSVRSDAASYDLPFGLLGLNALADELGSDLQHMQVSVNMSKVTGEAAQRVSEAARQSGVQIMGDFIDFSVAVEADGRTREIKEFGSTYVSRSIILPNQVEGSSATAVLYDPVTGEMTFVPAVFKTENGKTHVTIKRNGNSVYTVAAANKTFADLVNHWAKTDIELLASKLLVSGKTGTSFAPEDAITRAEFAALTVRALGLSQNKAGAKFSDVKESDWYAGIVGAAVKAGIINGYEDGSFRPNDRITREQMAVLITRAMAFAGKSADVTGRQDLLLAKFSDRKDISSWAQAAVARSVEAGIIQGRTSDTFAAKDDATRAQAVVMLKRLLKYVEFID